MKKDFLQLVRQSVPTKLMLVLLLVCLQAITVTTILALSRTTNELVLLRQARQLLNNATREIHLHTQEFLDSAQYAASLSAELFSTRFFDAKNIELAEQFFVSQLNYNNEFEGIYMGSNTGEFFYVKNEPDAAIGKFRVKHILPATDTKIWWRTPTYSKVSEFEDPKDKFDPRSRPWYLKSLAKNSLVWTSPYIFNTSKELGVTASSPLRDDSNLMVGALGVDIKLSSLETFLDKLSFNKIGSLFIVTTDGFLIASASSVKGQVSGKNTNKAARRIENPVAQKAFDKIMETFDSKAFGGNEVFEASGEQYITAFLPLSLPDGSLWIIGAYAAQDKFLAEIRENELRNILIACGVLVFSMLIGYALTGKAWRPVEELHDQANKDQLTHIYNRHYLEKASVHYIEAATQIGQYLSVVVIDIDHFKNVNDTHGHSVGDEVLSAFAQRLSQLLRKFDLVARYGGEEFVLLLPSTDAKTAEHIIDRAKNSMCDKAYTTKAGALNITFSAGVAELSEELNTFEKVFDAADNALYLAKQNGRNRVVLASA